MKTRYCGDVTIQLQFRGVKDDRLWFSGKIVLGTDWWEFDEVLVERNRTTESEGVLPAAFNIAATGACHYGARYGSLHEGEVPDWAPAAAFADAINDALEVDDRGYCIQRERDGPIVYRG